MSRICLMILIVCSLALAGCEQSLEKALASCNGQLCSWRLELLDGRYGSSRFGFGLSKPLCIQNPVNLTVDAKINGTTRTIGPSPFYFNSWGASGNIDLTSSGCLTAADLATIRPSSIRGQVLFFRKGDNFVTCPGPGQCIAYRLGVTDQITPIIVDCRLVIRVKVFPAKGNSNGVLCTPCPLAFGCI